jgi:hypothetical protein
LKKIFVPIATSEIVYDDRSPSVNTHLYWEMALAGRHFSGFNTTPVKKTSKGGDRFKKAASDRDSNAMGN